MDYLVDHETFGRLAKAARIIAGYGSVKDACQAMSDELGFEMSTRRLYNIEAGKVSTTQEDWVAFMLLYRPPDGLLYFWRAFSPEVRERLGGLLDGAKREL